jgi:hypothetical protein
MHVYQLKHFHTDVDRSYFGTREAAHAAAKALPKERWGFVAITLLNLLTDRESLVMTLNGTPQWEVLREWELTARGGLKEAKPEAD